MKDIWRNRDSIYFCLTIHVSPIFMALYRIQHAPKIQKPLQIEAACIKGLGFFTAAVMLGA